METLLSRLWCELLGLEAAGLRDNFFDLGGNSLLSMEAAARMEKQTGVRVSPTTMASQTLMQLAAVYDRSSLARTAPPAGPPACGTSDQPGMQPFFLGSADRQLWCVYHPPEPTTSPRGGIVLCQPFGWEYYTCHPSCRQLAQRLSRAGFAVLRFDYFATGDSAGRCDQARVERWLEDIATVVSEMDHRGHVCRCLIGLRFGATLAALFGAARGGLPALVLWEPVADGNRYLHELKTRQEAELGGAETLPDELFGMMVSPDLRAGIASTCLSNLCRMPAERILLLESDSAAEPSLAAALRRTSAVVDRKVVADPAFWNVRGNTLALAARTATQLIAWVEETCP